ncbi:uncharacterized protein PFL1_02387 [Pseudozyma flocculosa PF-1]|uniref:Zn(2)-C6 fungal-type domain-containing protein n=1 Tax=Pseudozyma flocculosa TaxID=84751 RepID=A0A5C3F8W2_9BASI|nr:uncharacterized protein PFL1_02387 [Pseudozyma flocculosa PF-1]EPQ30271.1 hypothetical protein PFL1_02387 [Pseudozyma flocculosa PF-1]SPO39789.1 uncharacterized protein PSFLO_05270 [Pseudozyma flocculosa]
MPRRQKRVIVTSCDSCRLRKLRCNAKELPHGTSCSQCVKSKTACTFDDFTESMRPLAKARTPRSIPLATPAPSPGTETYLPLPLDVGGGSGGGGVYQGGPAFAFPTAPGMASPWTLSPSLTGSPASFDHASMSVVPGSYCGNGLAGQPPLSSGLAPMPLQDGPEAMPSTAGGSRRNSNSGHRGGNRNKRSRPSKAVAEVPACDTPPEGKKGRFLPLIDADRASIDKPGPWTGWGLPGSITDQTTGERVEATAFAMAALLFDRFYSQPTLLSLVVSYEELFGRINVLIAQQQDDVERRSSGTALIPEYLLLAVAATAAASTATREPELRQWWKQHGWSLAMNSINAELRRGDVQQLELVQALLVVAISWTGEPESVDRIVLFETAIKVSFRLHLNSARRLQGSTSPAERAKRICLYWLVYVVDKLVAIAAGRPAMVAWELCDMPMLALEDLVAYGSSNLTSRSSKPQQSREQLFWLHNLALCQIALARILEQVQHDLYPIAAPRPRWSMAAIQDAIRPNEERLVDWCKCSRDLIRGASKLGGTCQMAAEAVVSQLHLVQIQLYQLPLQFEAEVLSSQASHQRANAAGHVDINIDVGTGHYGQQPQQQQQRVQFSEVNFKALTACLESAWHLVQQSGSCHGALPTVIAARLASDDELVPTDSGPTSFGMIKAVRLFRFLARFWDSWDRGFGLLRSLHSAPEQAQQAAGDAATSLVAESNDAVESFQAAQLDARPEVQPLQASGQYELGPHAVGHDRVPHSGYGSHSADASAAYGQQHHHQEHQQHHDHHLQHQHQRRRTVPAPLELGAAMQRTGQSGLESSLATCSSFHAHLPSATPPAVDHHAAGPLSMDPGDLGFGWTPSTMAASGAAASTTMAVSSLAAAAVTATATTTDAVTMGAKEEGRSSSSSSSYHAYRLQRDPTDDGAPSSEVVEAATSCTPRSSGGCSGGSGDSPPSTVPCSLEHGPYHRPSSLYVDGDVSAVTEEGLAGAMPLPRSTVVKVESEDGRDEAVRDYRTQPRSAALIESCDTSLPASPSTDGEEMLRATGRDRPVSLHADEDEDEDVKLSSLRLEGAGRPRPTPRREREEHHGEVDGDGEGDGDSDDAVPPRDEGRAE